MTHDAKHYDFRIRGVPAARGQLKAQDLLRALSALIKISRCATSLLTTGAGACRGASPAWLNNALDFTVTGLTPEPTVIGVESPRLADVAGSPFAKDDLWLDTTRPDPDDTALDLASQAIREAQSHAASGDRFDGAVLDAIVGLGNAVRSEAVCFVLSAPESKSAGFVLDQSACREIKARRRSIPRSQAFIVSGKLDQIAHHSRRFQIEVGEGEVLHGRWSTEAGNMEALDPLLGKPATVQGIVHFKANGQPRLIEADRIAASEDLDHVFEKLPSAAESLLPGPVNPRAKAGRGANFMDLVGTWPGNESVEELLAALR